jgi:4-amino-4-deoxy-L-arabinose transferase-like glycosyltransferase
MTPKRWNLIIVLGIVGLAAWIVLVLLSTIFGENHDLGDDAVLIGAAAGFLTVLFNQVRHGNQIKRTEDKIDRVYEHVNNVEEQEAIPEGETEKVTLGSMLRGIDRKLDAMNGRIDQIYSEFDITDQPG